MKSFAEFSKGTDLDEGIVSGLKLSDYTKKEHTTSSQIKTMNDLINKGFTIWTKGNLRKGVDLGMIQDAFILQNKEGMVYVVYPDGTYEVGKEAGKLPATRPGPKFGTPAFQKRGWRHVGEPWKSEV